MNYNKVVFIRIKKNLDIILCVINYHYNVYMLFSDDENIHKVIHKWCYLFLWQSNIIQMSTWSLRSSHVSYFR